MKGRTVASPAAETPRCVTTAATDKAVYEGLDAPTVLLFMEGTDGTYTIDFTGKPANLRWVESRSRNPLNLTITAPAGNLLEKMVICDGGQITYTGNVDQVTLKTTQWQTPEITINGDVSELTYYDTASDSPFKGLFFYPKFLTQRGGASADAAISTKKTCHCEKAGHPPTWQSQPKKMNLFDR